MSKLLEDGLSDEEPDMEIQIKTLMGTTIDIEVNSEQTVGDIKRKISRVEGIPVYQQNLIFRSGELRDASRLCDVGVGHGAVLTLVTSMRGGPISTRRLSLACEHHIVLKELKKLLENTRDEIAPGSKVSVLVFKEGDIINLLRVIENEDGSYSPYMEKPISPPNKPNRRESRSCVFERLVEDSQMSNKIASLRKKMAEVSLRKQSKTSTEEDEESEGNEMFASGSSTSLSFKFLSDSILDKNDLKIFEKTSEEDNQSESEEVALKDKHRSKPGRLPKTKSVYSESKGEYSHTKSTYTRLHKKKDSRNYELPSRDRKVDPIAEASASLAEQLTVLEEDSEEVYGEAVSVSARNRVHLARLIFSEGAERPKSSPDGIELEENAQDLWEIHEPASERLKHSATCKVGLLKRRQSVEYGYEGLENASNIKPEIGNCKNSGYGVCSSNLYMPQFVSAPSAIPPQYAPKDSSFCNYYISNAPPPRTPLYGRRTREDGGGGEPPRLPDIEDGHLGDCSSIQRLRNDCADGRERAGDAFGRRGPGGAADVLGNAAGALPPVVKRRARCGECNRRLNITNIYGCRCGRIFCSQHRYSEVHRCNYDYKTEGRKILEQQNPLVTAEKVKQI